MIETQPKMMSPPTPRELNFFCELRTLLEEHTVKLQQRSKQADVQARKEIARLRETLAWQSNELRLAVEEVGALRSALHRTNERQVALRADIQHLATENSRLRHERENARAGLHALQVLVRDNLAGGNDESLSSPVGHKRNEITSMECQQISLELLKQPVQQARPHTDECQSRKRRRSGSIKKREDSPQAKSGGSSEFHTTVPCDIS